MARRRMNGDNSDGSSRKRRDDVYGHGTSLRGVDLEEQTATSTKIQRQRWVDFYYRLWERKAKIDIADTIVIIDGEPRDWFFTSAATGELQRKTDSHLNAISIKRDFVRHGETTAIARQLALLVHEDNDGDMAYALLNDLDFNLVLCQPTSPLWTASFLLQPYLPATKRHPQWPGVFVAKFHNTKTPSIRAMYSGDSGFHNLKQTPVNSPSVVATASSTTANSRCTGASAATLPRGVEELIRMETTKLVAEIEAGSKDALRQLHAEFQITRTHRLVLRRVNRVVFASDLKRQDRRGASRTQARPASASQARSSTRCVGGRFCLCTAFATGEINKTSTALSKSNDLQQITRKSLLMCEDESTFLDRFGAHAEAHLEAARMDSGAKSVSARPSSPTHGAGNGQNYKETEAYEAFKRLLQRRMFMLRSTMWNPESESFHAKPLAWEDEKKKQSQQYEMVRVCRTCYLIYHTMDAERFQATKSTVKAAARRLTLLHNAKMLGEKRHVHPRRQQHAWAEADGDGKEDTSEDENDLHASHGTRQETESWRS